jgi:hypothetical protein
LADSENIRPLFNLFPEVLRVESGVADNTLMSAPLCVIERSRLTQFRAKIGFWAASR